MLGISLCLNLPESTNCYYLKSVTDVSKLWKHAWSTCQLFIVAHCHCPLVSRVQLNILAALVKVIIKQNRKHYCKCFADAWNVVGNDSYNSRCDWSSRLARSVNYGIRCGKQKKTSKEKEERLTIIELGYGKI